MELVIENRLDRLQFTIRGATLLRTLRMQDASCTGLLFFYYGLIGRCLFVLVGEKFKF